MQFLECKYFTKISLLVFMSTMILWISSLFPNKSTNGFSQFDRKAVSCHPLEKGDPSLNTINSLQPLFNST